MSAKEELFDLIAIASPKKASIIQRIINLSDEQIDQLLTLHSQQEKESYQTDPVQHLTSA